MKTLFKKLLVIIVLLTVTLVSVAPRPASADLASMQKAVISFTFDDGFKTVYTNALPIMNAAGYKGTVYYVTSYGNGGTTDDGKPSMTWADVQSLQNTYGWEIGSHTVNHTPLAPLTAAQVDQELAQSRSDLIAHGITPATSFAFPEGDYLTNTLPQTAKYYYSARGFQDVGLMSYPYNRIVLKDESLDANMTLAQAEALVDQAIANKQWLIFTGHGIGAADPNYAYIWTTANFQALVNYIKSKNVPVQKVGDVIAPPSQNLVTNAGFEQPLTTGWTTNNATQVTRDSNNNGSFPNPVNALKMTGGATAGNLFSSLIDVVPGATYLLDAFVNTTGLTSGEFGFYLDEYDANNNWISGQWLGFVANNVATMFDKVITATSTLVSKFGVQTYLTAGATGTVYTDNINLYNLDASASATPSVSPSVSPSVTPSVTPQQGNLVENGDFDSALTGKWSTNNTTAVKIDTNNHGTAPSAQTSVGMTGTTTASHLFYGLLPIDNTLTYAFSTFVNTSALTSGELGFYMDEYDQTGVWISGQWLGNVVNGVSTTFSKLYKATTNLVSSVRIQTYLTANATGTGYVDGYNLSAQVTPTATPSVSPSVSPTGTPSATPTPTGSVTPTPSVTGTPGNLVTNGNFNNGITGNWTTNNATQVKLDTTSKGGSAVNSVAMTGSAASSYLFFGLLPIDPNASYNLSAFVNANVLTAGELGFYMDEYDVNGNWISGQWLGSVVNGITSTFSKVYKATSTLVSSIRIQTYINAGSTGTAYVDDYSLTNSSNPTSTPTPTATGTPSVTPTVTTTPSVTPTATPTPTVSVTPTPTPNGTNLLQNGSFETVVSGFPSNWTKDGTSITLDTTSKGDNGANSLHLVPTSTDYPHLFSDMITVIPGTTYHWKSFISNLSGTGEFGFYIDEYDSAGNWISGQWKGMLASIFTGIQDITYVPSSATVAKVRLQYYAVPNSTFNLYLDSVYFGN